MSPVHFVLTLCVLTLFNIIGSQEVFVLSLSVGSFPGLVVVFNGEA